MAWLIALGAMTLLVTWFPACRSSQDQGPASNKSRHSPARPRSSSLVVGLDELTAQVGDLVTRLSTDDLGRMVNPQASLTMEAIRRLALALGTWTPDPAGYPPWARDLDTQMRYAKQVLDANEDMLRQRMSLLGRMALALTLRHSGPPKGCRTAHGPVHPVTRLLGVNHWSGLPRRLADRLLAPYDHMARITVRCDQVTWRLTAFHHKTGTRWLLAELDEEAPELAKWRYEPIPSTNVFGRRCLPSPRALAEAILQAGRTSRPLAPFVSLKLSAVFALLTGPPDGNKTDETPLGAVMDHWPRVAARTRLITWRTIAGLAATTDWASCQGPEMGAEERAQIQRILQHAPNRREAGTWFFSQVASIRTARIRCKSQVLTFTMGKSTKKHCWVLLAWDRRLTEPDDTTKQAPTNAQDPASRASGPTKPAMPPGKATSAPPPPASL